MTSTTFRISQTGLGKMKMGLVSVLSMILLHRTAYANTEASAHNAALILFQSNEMELLGDWLTYHARIFGWDSIYIIDHKSDMPVVTNWLERAKEKGAHVIHFQGSFKQKQKILTSTIQKIFADNPETEFAIPIDADEFIVAATDGNATLITDPGTIVAELAALPRDGFKYKFTESLAVFCSQHNVSLSGPERRVTNALLFDELTFGIRHKTFFYRDGFIGTDPGNHFGFVEKDDMCDKVVSGDITGPEFMYGGSDGTEEDMLSCHHKSNLALIHYGHKALSFESWKQKNIRGAAALGYDLGGECRGPGVHYCKMIKRLNEDEDGTRKWFEDRNCEGPLYYSQFIASAVFGDMSETLEFSTKISD